MKQLYQWLSRLPLPLLYGLSSLFAFVLYRVVRYRRAVVADNLRHAFPESSPQELARIERGVYRHLADLGMEMIASRHMPRESFPKHVRLENPEMLLPYKEQKQPVLFLTCHQGNWEWLLPVVSDYMGCPIDVVYKTLHDSGFDSHIYDARARSGKPIAFQDAGREIIRRRREFRGFAMLADQAPFKRDKRYWRNFLNRPGSFYLGPQKIAELTQYPVVFVTMTKHRRGRYSARFDIIAAPPHAKGGFAVLDQYIDAVERAIRAQPETWMWSNRKWKHQPPTDWLQNPVTE